MRLKSSVIAYRKMLVVLALSVVAGLVLGVCTSDARSAGVERSEGRIVGTHGNAPIVITTDSATGTTCYTVGDRGSYGGISISVCSLIVAKPERLEETR